MLAAAYFAAARRRIPCPVAVRWFARLSAGANEIRTAGPSRWSCCFWLEQERRKREKRTISKALAAAGTERSNLVCSSSESERTAQWSRVARSPALGCAAQRTLLSDH